jgi:MFS family permease
LTYRQLLAENRDFRHLWLGQVVAEIGQWLNNISVLALTLELAGAESQGRAVAFYAIARHLPLFLFGPVAGVVADRFNRKHVMIWADVVRALLALGFLFAAAYRALPVIYLVGAMLFAVSAFFNAAKRAALPNLVHGETELLGANALSTSTTAATIAIGSALGGIAAALLGRNAVFCLNAFSFLISAEMIRRIASPTSRLWSEEKGENSSPNALIEKKDDETKNEVSEVRPKRRKININLFVSALKRAFSETLSGWAYVRGNETLTAIFVIAAGWGLGNGAARALYSVFGARLGVDALTNIAEHPADFGISVLFVAMGFGGVVGAPLARKFALSAGHHRRTPLGTLMGRALILDGLALALFSLMPTLWSAAAMLVVREINYAVWWSAQATLIMQRTDDRFSGRVFASYETLTTLTMVGSMLASGAAADAYGIRPVAFIAGLIVALSGALWFFRRWRKQESEKRAAQI